MTSINLSIYDAVCSYCWDRINGKEVIKKNKILFKIGREYQWACCEKHKNILIKFIKGINPKNKNKVVVLWKGNVNKNNEWEKVIKQKLGDKKVVEE